MKAYASVLQCLALNNSGVGQRVFSGAGWLQRWLLFCGSEVDGSPVKWPNQAHNPVSRSSAGAPSGLCCLGETKPSCTSSYSSCSCSCSPCCSSSSFFYFSSSSSPCCSCSCCSSSSPSSFSTS